MIASTDSERSAAGPKAAPTSPFALEIRYAQGNGPGLPFPAGDSAVRGRHRLGGSQGGQRVGGVPVFALCGVLCFALNWLVFIHAYSAQTERYFDLTGSLTYLAAIACAVALGNRDPRALLLALLVGVWAVAARYLSLLAHPP